MILIFVTFPNKKEAENIAGHLMKKKLAGCITMFPVQTRYWWKGKQVKDTEMEAIIKTKDANFDAIRKEIENLHSYTVPQIISISAKKVNKKYNDWMEGEVN